MAVRTAYVATESIGDVLTKANFDKLPGGCIGYAQVTANQTGIVAGATTDLTNLTVTPTINTSRRIRISAKVDATSGTAGDLLQLLIREGSTTLQTVSFTHLSGTSYSILQTSIDLSPTAAAHTYKLSLLCTGTGAATIQQSATQIAFITVDDIGPAFQMSEPSAERSVEGELMVIRTFWHDVCVSTWVQRLSERDEVASD